MHSAGSRFFLSSSVQLPFVRLTLESDAEMFHRVRRTGTSTRRGERKAIDGRFWFFYFSPPAFTVIVVSHLSELLTLGCGEAITGLAHLAVLFFFLVLFFFFFVHLRNIGTVEVETREKLSVRRRRRGLRIGHGRLGDAKRRRNDTKRRRGLCRCKCLFTSRVICYHHIVVVVDLHGLKLLLLNTLGSLR